MANYWLVARHDGWQIGRKQVSQAHIALKFLLVRIGALVIPSYIQKGIFGLLLHVGCRSNGAALFVS